MRIAEIFESIQGEGEFAGTPSVFVRTTGCNLRCWFCDTPYTSIRPEGDVRDWRDVARDVLQLESQHVVLTGGEPLLQADIVPLAKMLRQNERVVTIETAGTVFRDVEADLMSISPKLSNSAYRGESRWRMRHNRDRHRPDVIRSFISQYPYQLKFVVDQPVDLEEIVQYVEQFEDVTNDHVWLMPQGTIQKDLEEKAIWLVPQAASLGYRFCPRLHIEMFGSIRGT